MSNLSASTMSQLVSTVTHLAKVSNPQRKINILVQTYVSC